MEAASTKALITAKLNELKKWTSEASQAANSDDSIRSYEKVIFDPLTIKDEDIIKAKEEAIYSLGEILCKLARPNELRDLLKRLRPFFQELPKAKTAKIVRTIIELVGKIPDTQDVQIEICKESIEWSQQEKRTFLRQRIESRLAELYFEKQKYNEAQVLINKLVREVRRLDDKALLVEIHLMESHLWHALNSIAKSRASLTAARTAANGIYCPPLLQAEIDMQSGILHAEEKDYKTGFSYFIEAFDGYQNLGDKLAVKCLKYMLLCKIMTNQPEDVNNILSSKNVLKVQAVELKTPEIEAMRSVSKAYQQRSLHAFEDSLKQYKNELVEDPIVKSHLNELYNNLLEQHLIRIIEPFSRVEISHIANLIGLQKIKVENKLSQMILDKKLNGILDAGKDCLVVYDDVKQDKLYPQGLSVIDNMNTVLDSLFDRTKQLH